MLTVHKKCISVAHKTHNLDMATQTRHMGALLKYGISGVMLLFGGLHGQGSNINKECHEESLDYTGKDLYIQIVQIRNLQY